MNVKRFTARTSRDALTLVREAFGDEAVVLSTRPCPQGVEVLAMAPDGMQQIERVAAPVVSAPAEAASRAAAPAAPAAQTVGGATSVDQDVERLSMSTLSFQDYVRERMLRRRKAQLSGDAGAADPAPGASPETLSAVVGAHLSASSFERRAGSSMQRREAEAAAPRATAQRTPPASVAEALGAASARSLASTADADADSAFDTLAAPRVADSTFDVPRVQPSVGQWRGVEQPVVAAKGQVANLTGKAEMPASMALAEQTEVISELRAVRGLIEERFSALAFLEKLQRQPRQAQLSQRLLDAGYSPALCRKLSEGLPADVEEMAWAASVLERNLLTGEKETALEDAGGVYAMVGSTGVGKTTSTAKLAAAFAARHGAANLGLITLDAYRIAAHEQLRAYGRILGVPVHTAHDRASLEDLLDLLSGKKMVLIDTAGMPQRDARTRELLDMLGHRAIQRLLVVNAAAQGETLEDVLVAYRASQCRGVILSKLDESMKLGPALDAVIRHKVKVLAVANGQRVPEDWHRLSAATLVQRSLRASGASTAWKMDASDVNLVFTGRPLGTAGASSTLHA